MMLSPKLVPSITLRVAAPAMAAAVPLCAATDWSPARMDAPWPLLLKP